MKKDMFSLVYKIVIVIISFVALYLNFKFLSIRTSIVYFTYISNIACFIYFLILVIRILTKKHKEDKYYYIIKGMITMAIGLTMVVYNSILSEGNLTYINHELECHLVHLIIPLLVILDYIIFDKKGNLKKKYPLIWAIPLLVYQGIITVYSLLGGKFIDGADFPYVYMDTAKFGELGVLVNYILIFSIFMVCGVLVVLIDSYVGKKEKV